MTLINTVPRQGPFALLNTVRILLNPGTERRLPLEKQAPFTLWTIWLFLGIPLAPALLCGMTALRRSKFPLGPGELRAEAVWGVMMMRMTTTNND